MELATQQNLTKIEQSELSRLESIIETNLQTCFDVGSALTKIRDSGLYKMYGTFERYCKERWGYARRTVYQFIDAAKIAENLCAIEHKPTQESQLRPLTHLEPEEQREVWQKAVETAPEGKVTAQHVQDVVDEMEDKGDQPDEPIEIESSRAKKDSKNLSQLKFYWGEASAGDKKKFRRWLRSQKD